MLILPPADCTLCPRLADFRAANQAAFPDFFNAPVPPFGDSPVRLMIVGLAPGLKGANRTGRPFTGDYAGDLLYPTLIKFGWAEGSYGRSPDDGLRLTGCRITNAVKCVPPQNKPTPAEINTCRHFIISEIEAESRLTVILALGSIAHNTVLSTLKLRKASYPFAHNAMHVLPSSVMGGGVTLADSYHCSRYNTNTGRLTTEMFEDVFRSIAERMG
ncbi:MAG: uracil-DNA glycosylase [Alphaproteobacteria bacterium]|nr:uracil-DNA glycosylase [Alphaproteobacteria bacterium]MBU0796476.1 uracil-DNA glycosylase [Alphaproteobacteria bacterium]MBU0885649.1 uracil-DNA glycosylase [Alphaproteobacteria bacterium]MBU1812695.1 uracil-DNA glycosylase [Alphaproteobacteria bacterium]MBU2089506.1 uracil-DNA glycosylase [Alphaproteobacteria bacterium]